MIYYEIERQTAGDTILNKYLEDPVLQCRRDWKTKFKETLHYSKPYSERELKDLQVNFDSLEKQITVLEDHKILFTELGSETDFLTLTNRLDLLETLVESLKNTYRRDVLLGVHYSGTTISELENSEIKFDAYVTPIKRMGVMIFPTREIAVKVTRAAKKPVIATKPLTGSRIKPKEGLEYVYNEMGIDFCMVGVGSVREAKEDFAVAHEILKKYIN